MKNLLIGLAVVLVLILGVWIFYQNALTNSSAEMVECPVMGTKMNSDRAHAKTIHDGKTYYFCCGGCPEQFRRNPDKYIK